jgi:alpha-1,2-mannosyltransferase
MAGRRPSGERTGSGDRILLAAGAAVALAAAIAYIAALATHPVTALLKGFDLSVYLGGAGQALHHPGNLYTWSYQGHPSIKFTYTPFAALLFTAGRAVPFRALMGLVALVSTFSLLATVWIAFRELGWRPVARAGATLAVSGLAFWTEPVQRGLFLGQVDLALMALITWDLCQPGRRWWKGAATGFAAGINLIPGLFVVYLLLTRRFRQALAAVAAFAVMVIIGFAVLPGPSVTYWLDGSFFRAGRTGFVGDQENQSLRGIMTRLIGSVNGAVVPWYLAALVVAAAGLACAVALHRRGQSFAGLMTCALTALLVSPITWDHMWTWIAPGVAVLADAAVRYRERWWYLLAGAVLAAFGAWPDFWSARAGLLQGGLINYAPASAFAQGDNPAYAEYHWHGLQLIAGNLYILAGLGLFAVALVTACRVARARPRDPLPAP